MKFLESYCNKLLKWSKTCESELRGGQFFMPKDRDLQPEFTKKSIMINAVRGSARW
ncbi:hypothetical protein FQN60_003378 [Etheostoma spectabile]|uniref:Uncharacterized protein n=1 Tax=Etheostoma spectabile TaxID=54343 RepID=A0A5J5CJF5_9PERO|nr:hypothetical protein FQN60_003378 [Etheostoma spectabile]